MGVVGAVVMFMGSHQISTGKLTLGGFSPTSSSWDTSLRRFSRWSASGRSSPRQSPDSSAPAKCSTKSPRTRTRAASTGSAASTAISNFEDVVFAYDDQKAVLHESVSVQPGTLTALVGSSGSGKSTIICADRGLSRAARAGAVDGVDLSTVRLDSYRSQLGVVLQDSFLFDGTIRENVAFSRRMRPKRRCSKPAALRASTSLPRAFRKKYETMVGERGVKLSGGQRQRVSIARAILADPRILILDEATSSLDSESEAMIQDGLAYLMQGRTTFVIAHRLSTIRRADQILVVEAGRIVERGNPRQPARARRPLLRPLHPPAWPGSKTSSSRPARVTLSRKLTLYPRTAALPIQTPLPFCVNPPRRFSFGIEAILESNVAPATHRS